MHKWEYLVARAYYGQVIEVNGNDKKERDLLHDFLNTMGNEQWEVVSCTVIGDSLTIIMKRPK